ncbi:hypothetical protein [Pantoea sp. B65]|uniref:hypothetical protein n=1 Tax=Pantoea sp. B65 TaxID=2813359 RepID=UPI0039B6D5FE
MKKIIMAVFSLSLLTVASISFAASPFTGWWRGEIIDAQDGDTISMSIWLNESGGKIVGRYCLIYQGGNRTDCPADDYETNIHGKVDGSGKANIRFESWSGRKNGRATLTINREVMTWNLIKKPIREVRFIPSRFELIKKSDIYHELKYRREFNTVSYNLSVVNRCNDFMSACNNVTLLAIANKVDDAFMLSGKAILATDNSLDFIFSDQEGKDKAELKNSVLTLERAGKSVREKGEWKDKP